MYKLAAYGTR